jgi:type III secretion system low calcium response chaperone LcrH/SycD
MKKKSVRRLESVKRILTDEDYDTLYSLAYSLYGTGDYGRAREIFHRLVLSHPFQKRYWMGLGACYQLEKSYEQALRAWSMVALLDDTDPTPHSQAAECYFSMRNEEEGEKALRAAKERLENGNS